MLIGVKQQIKEGQPVPVTLVFKRAGAVRVLAIAASMGAAEEPVHR
jgi:copper(I)-binding protein